jgi:hypothetical protein
VPVLQQRLGGLGIGLHPHRAPHPMGGDDAPEQRVAGQAAAAGAGCAPWLLR